MDQNRYVQELNRKVWYNATECIRLLIVLHKHDLVDQECDKEVTKADKIDNRHAT